MPSPAQPDRVGDLLRTASDDNLVCDLFTDAEGIIRSVLGPRDPHLIQTAVHDALLAAVRYRHRFRGDSLGSTWFYTVARREALRVARRETKRAAAEVSLEDEADQPQGTLPATDPEAVVALVARELLAELVPNPAWRRIWLLHNDPCLCLSHAQIAEVTGRTEGTIAVTLSRVRALLAEAELDAVA